MGGGGGGEGGMGGGELAPPPSFQKNVFSPYKMDNFSNLPPQLLKNYPPEILKNLSTFPPTLRPMPRSDSLPFSICEGFKILGGGGENFNNLLGWGRRFHYLGGGRRKFYQSFLFYIAFFIQILPKPPFLSLTKLIIVPDLPDSVRTLPTFEFCIMTNAGRGGQGSYRLPINFSP